MRKLIGKIVSVSFLDHAVKERGAHSGKPALQFTVYGKVKSVSKKVLIIKTWELNTDDKDILHNEEHAEILISTILLIKELA